MAENNMPNAPALPSTVAFSVGTPFSLEEFEVALEAYKESYVEF